MRQTKYDIFISYRRVGGKGYARMLKPELEKRGFRVFLDFDNLDDGVFNQHIKDAINESSIFLIILSDGALDRCVNEGDWVREEIKYAEKCHCHIVPVEFDKKFRKMPETTPDDISSIIGAHSWAQIDTETLLQESINKMVEKRIRPHVLQTDENNASANRLLQEGVEVHVDVDADCNLFCFKTFMCHLREGEDNIVYLKSGKYKLSFVSAEVPEVKSTEVHDLETGKKCDYIEIHLKADIEKVLAKRKAEEEAKRKAEEEAKRKAEEEAKRKAEEAKRKVEEARLKAAEDARRKAEEEARLKAVEDARRKAEEEKKRTEEAQRKAEEDSRKQREERLQKEEEEARRKRRQRKIEDDPAWIAEVMCILFILYLIFNNIIKNYWGITKDTTEYMFFLPATFMSMLLVVDIVCKRDVRDWCALIISSLFSCFGCPLIIICLPNLALFIGYLLAFLSLFTWPEIIGGSLIDINKKGANINIKLAWPILIATLVLIEINGAFHVDAENLICFKFTDINGFIFLFCISCILYIVTLLLSFLSKKNRSIGYHFSFKTIFTSILVSLFYVEVLVWSLYKCFEGSGLWWQYLNTY